ncbi:glycosyltransferase family 2 protein [Argonema galeatum]|uniref:glycosyltransferase family 2 protein n=1 Tax=Argonema galeatum TaxID=2942762 RepID=UPI002012FE57|nr:glycosyltransferase family 2 protein [Argonema galeatum]MCL1467696.1 glycosyltransferase family 2 protein [Argonema galeatum A003/A1]
MKSNSIAVLMSCYNRKQKTLDCLADLFSQVLPDTVNLTVYLVDDGSTDGTSEAVEQAYPNVKILHGDGNLFWNGGMRWAFAEAMKSDCDYYLWLNDDTLLYPQALNTLLATERRLAEQGHLRTIIVGSACDPETGKLTYGGMVQSSWWHPLKFQLVEPSEQPQPCHTFNGNCVLLPRSVVEIVGNLDEAFKHRVGDLDYGLRSLRQGCTIWVDPYYVGTCPRNINQPLRLRLEKLAQPKGLPPQEWKIFSSRHAGLFWPIYWLLPYIRLRLLSALGRED